MLRVVGEFNNISKKLLETIPVLKPGQRVHFRRLDGVFDPLKKIYFYGSAKSVSCHDFIWDPFAEKTVEIGVLRDDAIVDGKVRRKGWKSFVLGGTDSGLLNEKFDLVGGRIEDMEFFAFFWLCNQRRDNQYRDKSVQPWFEYIDQEAEIKRFAKENDMLFAALQRARNMSADDIKIFAASQNWNLKDAGDDPISINKAFSARIQNYAKDNPKDFLEKVGDESNKLKADVKIAFDKGVISYDSLAHKVLNKTGATIATLEKNDSKNHVELFAEWVDTAVNGVKVMDGIRKQVAYILRKEAGTSTTKGDDE